jgi:phosphoribosylformylglycinamidine synthase subunit PurQ / glutaminase
VNFGVIRFPGSNCDDDAVHVVDWVLRPMGATGRILWHKEHALGDVDAVVVPGGFSYGDYLRAGAMAAHSPIMGAVKAFAEAGGPVLGICNGFQILCESGLLEGALTRNDSLRFVCADVYCRVEGRDTPFTHGLGEGAVLRMSVAHAEGRYTHPEIERLEASGQVLFRYCEAAGQVTPEANPNGSMDNIAGVCNPAGNVVGLMPHPERACEDLLGRGGEDGRLLFEAALAWSRGGGAAAPSSYGDAR